MSQMSFKTLLLGSAALLMAAPALAIPTHTAFVLDGDYIKLSVNDLGTIGQGNSSPGLLYDTTGTGTFNTADDYLTPGTPFEGFGLVASGQNYFNNNNQYFNGGPAPISGTVTDASSGTTNQAIWTGTYNDGSHDLFTLTNDLSFEDDGKAVKIITTITAHSDLTGVTFGRFIDPDVNVTSTENSRGSATIDPKNLVTAISPPKGYVLSLYSDDPVSHNTGISYLWSTDPATYLAGTDDGNGDYVIGLGFDLGDLLAGSNISFTYYYLFGDDISELDKIISSTLQAGDIINNLPDGVITMNGQTLAFTSNYSIGHDVAIGAGGGIFDTAGFDGVITGSVTGDACMTKTGAGKLDIRGDSANAVGACVEQGTLAMNAHFDGAVFVDAGAMLRGAGSINGRTEVTGTLAPGNSPGTLTFTDDVVMLPGSILQIDIDGTGTGNGAGNYGRVIVTGAANSFTADGTLTPLLRGITGNANNDYTPEVGTVFNIVNAEGGVTGTFTALTEPASGLAAGSQFEVFYGPTFVNLAVTPISYAAFAAENGNSNAAAAAKVVDTLRTADTGADLRAGLSGLGASGMAASLQQLSGEIHADAVTASVEGHRIGRDGVFHHLAGSRTLKKDGIDLWVEALGNRNRMKADSVAGGYHFDSNGMAAGIDKSVTPGLRIGVGAAMTNGDLSTDRQGSADVNSSQAFLYGSYSADGYFMDAVIAHSWDKYRTDRTILLSTGATRLTSRDKAHGWAIDAEAGTVIGFGGYRAEPVIGFRWDEASRDAVTESGSGTAALAINKTSDTVAQSKIGVRLSRAFATEATTILPQIRAYWTHDFNEIDSLVARLQGQSFMVASTTPGRNAAVLGAGLEVGLQNGLRLYVNYDAELRSGATLHGLNGGIRLRF